MTYWIPLIFIKHGVSVLVTPLKLLGSQFEQTLIEKKLSSVSITAENITDEMFKVRPCLSSKYQYILMSE
jgi:hypothetical protein